MKRPHLPRSLPARPACGAFILAIFALLFGTLSGAATAAEQTDTSVKLAKLAAELEERRAQAEAMQQHLDSLNEVIRDARDHYAELSAELAAVRKGIASSEAQFAELQEAFDAIVRDAYKDGGAGAVAAVVGATGEEHLRERMSMLWMLADSNRDVLAQTEAMRSSLEARTAYVQQLMTEQEETLAGIRLEQQQTLEQSLALQEAVADVEAAQASLLDTALASEGELGADDYERLQRALKGAKSVTYGQWARLFAVKIGAPPCRENSIALIAWQLNEGTDAQWNPLATTYDMPGATEFNWAGVKNYRSLAQGLQATWLTLKRGFDVYRYGDIVRSLRRCARAEETAEAINNSSWCYGCTYGEYVTGLIDKVRRDFTFYSKF